MLKKLLATLGLTTASVALAVGLAQPAHADPGDSSYLSCLESGWGFPSSDPIASIMWGHRIANAISSGGVSPLEERNYIYQYTDLSTLRRANVMVNCATLVYLGFGPSSFV